MRKISYAKRSTVAFEQLESRRVNIVGGNSINISMAPFAVALADKYGQFCGGSLIDETHVLTAAHCAQSDGVRAIINRTDLRTNLGEEIPIVGVKVHPKYNSRTLDNDIAVLTLSRPSTQGERIRNVKHDTLTDPGKSATVVGWGTTKSGGNPSNNLRAVTVPFVSNTAANRPTSYNGEVTKNMLAAGATGKDSCQGDSGGPLFLKNEAGELRQVGIVSWGAGCASPNYPGIYTRVANYYDWIENAVKQRSFDASTRQFGGRLRGESGDQDVLPLAGQALDASDAVFHSLGNSDSELELRTGPVAPAQQPDRNSTWGVCVETLFGTRPQNAQNTASNNVRREHPDPDLQIAPLELDWVTDI